MKVEKYSKRQDVRKKFLYTRCNYAPLGLWRVEKVANNWGVVWEITYKEQHDEGNQMFGLPIPVEFFDPQTEDGREVLINTYLWLYYRNRNWYQRYWVRGVELRSILTVNLNDILTTEAVKQIILEERG